MFNVDTATKKRTYTGLKGVYLHITPRGQKRWVFRFSRPQRRGVTEMSLGPATQKNFAQVQVRVMQLRAELAEGINPIEARKAAFTASTTFAETYDQYVEHNKRDWSASQLRNCKVLCHLHGAALLHVPVLSINRDDVVRVIMPLWESTPKQARKALAMWQSIFDFAEHPNNPTSWNKLKHKLPRPPREKLAKGHYKSMEYQHVPSFIAMLRSCQRATGAVALEFCILTATRPGETRKAEWSEFDLENRVWTIPAARMRKGAKDKEPRPHKIPLTDRVMELLKRQAELRVNNNPYVFVGYKQDRPLAPKALFPFIRGTGSEDTVHGFRASFKTWASEQTTHDRWLIEMCLSHSVGSDVEQAYQRGQVLERRRKIMEDWAAYCLSDPSLE
jgi:integrase